MAGNMYHRQKGVKCILRQREGVGKRQRETWSEVMEEVMRDTMERRQKGKKQI